MGKGVMAGRSGSWDAGSGDIEGEDGAEAGMGSSGSDGGRFATCATMHIGSNPPRSRQRALMMGAGESWDTGAGPINTRAGPEREGMAERHRVLALFVAIQKELHQAGATAVAA